MKNGLLENANPVRTGNDSSMIRERSQDITVLLPHETGNITGNYVKKEE